MGQADSTDRQVADSGHSQDPPTDFSADERFRPAERLRKRRSFLQTQRQGKRRAGRHYIVYARPNGLEWSRLGITASRRVGKATVRNWWKRRTREIFRRNKPDLPVGYDIVAIVKASADQSDYEVLREEFIELVRRASRAADGR